MRSALLVLLTAVATSCYDGGERGSEYSEAANASDEQQMIDRLSEAIGDSEAWEQMPRYVRFDFRIVFNGDEFLFSENLWDRWEGRYRTRWSAAYQDGTFDGFVDIGTGDGDVRIDGQPVPDERRAEILDAAVYRARNDMYWLFAPFKLGDPGVRVHAMEPEMLGGEEYDRLRISFDDGVGTSSGDQFWLYLNSETGRMDQWAFYLESFDGEPSLQQASVWRWGDWRRYGGVLVSTRRTLLRSPQFPQFESGTIEFPVLLFLDQVDDSVFSDFETPLPA